ncbi:MAG TPA: carboxy terminal-processing peptidase [Deltaproteobacteria bacterium]|nr:carboxy terminal-processing peptidase [Deltaproteobacteria bacterium]
MKAAIRFLRIFLLVVILGFTMGPSSFASPDASAVVFGEHSIRPLPEHGRVALEIIRDLKGNHFRKVTIDDALSSKVLDRLLEDIDGSRIYFTASDMKEFESFRYRIDDTLLRGDVSIPFWIYNHYHQRLGERLKFALGLIEAGVERLDLEKDEHFETDREKAAWPADDKELHDLWRKALKNEVITMMLEGKDARQIKDDLVKRFTNQVRRLDQTTSEDVFQVCMNSLTSCYDPHTSYFSPRSSENFSINMSLSLEGIGAMLTTENEHTKVVRLVPGGPAERSKLLKPNDRIVGVGQGDEGEIVDVVGWRLDDVVDLIRGPKNTPVRLKIIPASATNEHETRIVKIMRNTVRLEDQASSRDLVEIRRDGKTYRIGVIRVPTFYLDVKAMQNRQDNYKSSTRDVQRLLEELSGEGIHGVLVDLRDNGGGLLHEANTLTGLFIKTGPTVQVKSSDGYTETLYDRDPTVSYAGPMAVVVSRLSASASEILAGALQDYGRALVIGERSFGKGTVQTLLNLSRGQIKLTTSKFYRISGESTQHRGVLPDITYPGINDADKIGESALKDPLPWDKIDPVPHALYGEVTKYADRLRALHEERMRNDPDYAYVAAMNDYLKRARLKTRVSLRLSERIAEKERSESERLAIENRLRKAKGLDPVTRMADLEPLNEKEDDTPRPKPASEDAHLVECANILVDLITLAGAPSNGRPGHASAP